MKVVNDATMSTLEQFRNKAKELPWEAHPYFQVAQTRKKLGLPEWTAENRESAISGMAVWVMMVVGNSSAAVLNEIIGLMNIAAESSEENKKAADEMASSMHFLESVLKMFMASLDVQHIAEQLFEDGERMEKEREAEFAAAEAAKAKVAKQQKTAPTPQPLSGTVHRRWEPSQN